MINYLNEWSKVNITIKPTSLINGQKQIFTIMH